MMLYCQCLRLPTFGSVSLINKLLGSDMLVVGVVRFCLLCR